MFAHRSSLAIGLLVPVAVTSLACMSGKDSPPPLPDPTPVVVSEPEAACDVAACREDRVQLDNVYLRPTGGRRVIQARLWWLAIQRADGETDPASQSAELKSVLVETAAKQHEVFACEAECAGEPIPTAPATAEQCADLCIQATRCEIEVGAELGIPLTATGVTEDLMYCMDKCAFERPLAPYDIECFQDKECSTLADFVRSMKPGECPS